MFVNESSLTYIIYIYIYKYGPSMTYIMNKHLPIAEHDKVQTYTRI